jgi:hypothetical protein
MMSDTSQNDKSVDQLHVLPIGLPILGFTSHNASYTNATTPTLSVIEHAPSFNNISNDLFGNDAQMLAASTETFNVGDDQYGYLNYDLSVDSLQYYQEGQLVAPETNMMEQDDVLKNVDLNLNLAEFDSQYSKACGLQESHAFIVSDTHLHNYDPWQPAMSEFQSLHSAQQALQLYTSQRLHATQQLQPAHKSRVAQQVQVVAKFGPPVDLFMGGIMPGAIDDSRRAGYGPTITEEITTPGLNQPVEGALGTWFTAASTSLSSDLDSLGIIRAPADAECNLAFRGVDQQRPGKKCKRKNKGIHQARADFAVDTEESESRNAEQHGSTGVDSLPELNEHGMYFASLEEASAKVHGLTWPPRIDTTLPASVAARREIVKELHAAMNDMSGCQDKVGHVFKKRWVAENKDKLNEHHHPRSREKKCWEILVRLTTLLWYTEIPVLTCIQHVLERIYREGTHFISILDPTVLKEAEKWRHLTFRERKDMFVHLLRSFKCRTAALMRGPCLEEYALNVAKLIKESKTNRLNNELKQGQIEAGRRSSNIKSRKPSKHTSLYFLITDLTIVGSNADSETTVDLDLLASTTNVNTPLPSKIDSRKTFVSILTFFERPEVETWVQTGHPPSKFNN